MIKLCKLSISSKLNKKKNIKHCIRRETGQETGLEMKIATVYYYCYYYNNNQPLKGRHLGFPETCRCYNTYTKLLIKLAADIL